MINFTGTYFDGKTSKAYPVQVNFDGKVIIIKSNDNFSDREIDLKTCNIEAPLGKTSRIILLPDGERLESDDFAAISELETYKDDHKGLLLVHILEQRWKWVLSCIGLLVLCVWAFIIYGIPVVSYFAAFSMPIQLIEKISDNAEKVIDKRLFKPTTLSSDKTSQIEEMFQRTLKNRNSKFNYRIKFRNSPALGANAIALPSGVIFVTDGLVKMIKEDMELISILIHEKAHIEKHHGIRSIFQNVGVFFLISILVGDVASITSTAAALPTILVETGYTRDFEREADEAAAGFLVKNGYGVKPFQDILTRLTQKSKKKQGMSLFSTHPQTEERIKNLAEIEKSLLNK